MPETATKPSPSRESKPSEAELEESLERLRERERLLHSLLLEARDALIRQQLAAPVGSAGEEASDAGAQTGADYEGLRERLREYLAERLPSGSFVLVVSRGDDDLLAVDVDSRAWHFPTTGDGRYAGHHPADSETAIAALEKLRRRGAEFLVFPATSQWWLDHYDALARHLEARYDRAVDEPETCVVYDLRSSVGGDVIDRIAVDRVGIDGAAEPVPDEGTGRQPRGDTDRPLAAVTIISRNYLAQARVLAKSFLEHEPQSRFYVLVVDGLPDGVDFGADATLLDLEEIDIPELYEMCFKYGVVEFSTAVKPYVLAHLFDRYDEEEIAYFDPDILVVRQLAELRRALERGDIVLTPHIMQPLPLDGKRPTEQDIMISGAYNLGFIALRRSPESRDFLDWWQERLQDGCRIDVPNGLFTDQKWIDLVPSLFPGAEILRDPTYNVAFWNLHERSISRREGRFLVNGRPGGFFHLSGYSPAEPDQLSKHQNRIEIAPGSSLEALLALYSSRLEEEGFDESSGWEYGFERFDNGIRVHPLLRQIYLNLDAEERRRFRNPFATGEPDSFLDWATRPASDDGDLSPFLATIYEVRYDLASIFPDVRGDDRAAFLKWARRWGSVEMKFEAELVRDRPEQSLPPGESDSASGSRRTASESARQRSPERPPSLSASSYEALVASIRNVAQATLPAGSNVLVVSKGDPRLLDLGGSEGWHFPQTRDGVYGGYHPPDSEVAISHLESLRDKGAGYLLIPRTALWWLEYYPELRRHLERNYRPVVQSDDSCLIYSLRSPANGHRRRSMIGRWWRRLTGSASAAARAAG